jgi:N utilization substance protein B
MLLFHLEALKTKAEPVTVQALLEPQRLRALLRGAVYSLKQEAADQLEEAATLLQRSAEFFHTVQLEAPSNLATPVGAPVHSVPLPHTQESLDKVQQCLAAVELVWACLDLPELLVYAANPKVQGYIERLVFYCQEHDAELEATLEAYSEDWPLSRLVKMDKVLLKLALTELQLEHTAEKSVVLNEAIELAKRFSTEESHRFINGLLSRYLGDVEAAAAQKAADAADEASSPTQPA